jgi:uncharacterized damage-inducible protein DinB
VDAEFFRLLFSYSGWANQRVLERASKLREEDYFAPVAGLSFDTLHATLAHAYVADAVWLARWQGRPLTRHMADARQMDRIVETEVRTLEELVQRWRALELERLEYLAWLSDEDVKAPLAYRTTDGREFSQPLGEQMAHVINHGTQYRTEASVALTAHGFSPGDLDLAFYLRERG